MRSTLRRLLAVRRRYAPFIFLLPTVLIVLAFQIAPVLFAFIISVMRWDAVEGMAAAQFTGLDNYVWVFLEDEWFGASLGSTLWTLVVSGALIHLTAIPMAFFIQTRLRRYRNTLLTVYFLPFLVSAIILQFSFSILFGNSPEAPVNALLLAIGNFQLLGIKPFALERLEWSGKMPFEILRVNITSDGFVVAFTKPVEQVTGAATDSYSRRMVRCRFFTRCRFSSRQVFRFSSSSCGSLSSAGRSTSAELTVSRRPPWVMPVTRAR